MIDEGTRQRVLTKLAPRSARVADSLFEIWNAVDDLYDISSPRETRNDSKVVCDMLVKHAKGAPRALLEISGHQTHIRFQTPSLLHPSDRSRATKDPKKNDGWAKFIIPDRQKAPAPTPGHIQIQDAIAILMSYAGNAISESSFAVLSNGAVNRDPVAPTNGGNPDGGRSSEGGVGISGPTMGPISPEPDSEWVEGNPKLRAHLRKERARGLSRDKKADFIAQHGRLFCERCNLDPVTVFGAAHGNACIEVHHRATQVQHMAMDHVTRLADLQCLCANCHRVLHSELRDAD